MAEARGCSKKDFKEAARLTTKVFEDPFLENVSSKEEGFKYDDIRMIMENAVCRSALFVSNRKMRIQDTLISLSGIGGVATDPDARGKGYASMIMTDSVEHMTMDGYDMSLLFPFKPAFYAKFGYRSMIMNTKVVHVDALKQEIKDFTIRPFNNPADIAAVMKIHDEFNAKQTGSLLRNRYYWEHRLQTHLQKDTIDNFLVAESNGIIVAYAMNEKIRDDWDAPDFNYKIGEYCCLDGYEDAVNALFEKIAGDVAGEGKKILFYDVVDKMDIKYGKPMTEEEAEEHKDLRKNKMWKIVNISSLLRQITPLLNRRIRTMNYNNWQDVVGFERTILDDKNLNGKMAIDFIESDHRLEIEDIDFNKLLLGHTSFDKMNIPGADKLNQEDKKILAALFPELNPVYYDFDYI